MPSEGDAFLEEKAGQYKKIIGDLRYLANCTRTDLSYVIKRLGAAMANPSTGKWIVMKRVMRYIPATRDHRLVFKKSNELDKVVAAVKKRGIEASSDADWTNDGIDRKSLTGGYMTYQSMPVSWTSIKQAELETSNVEAEYRAMEDVIKKKI